MSKKISNKEKSKEAVKEMTKEMVKEMTKEEAIAMIQNDLRLHHDYLSSKYRKALRMAIEALEKQVEKEPAQLLKRREDCVDYECANCGMTYGLANPRIVKYCYHCGQAIKWEKGEKKGEK